MRIAAIIANASLLALLFYNLVFFELPRNGQEALCTLIVAVAPLLSLHVLFSRSPTAQSARAAPPPFPKQPSPVAADSLRCATAAD